MFSLAKIFAGLVGIARWFQEQFQRAQAKQEGRNEKDAETLKKVAEGKRARDLVGVDSDYTKRLLEELRAAPVPAIKPDGQLLSELRSRMSAPRGSSRYGAGYIKELRNIPTAVYKYSERSLGHLSTCEYKLQLVGLRVSERVDATVICGFRSMADQEKAFNSGASKVPPGASKHNRTPSAAMDIVPADAPRKWAKGKDLPAHRYFAFAELIQEIAKEEGIILRWGGDWDMDGDSTDQTFMDFAHWETI